MELQNLFLIILAAVSVLYLVMLFFKYGIFHVIVKCALMPLLIAVYVSGAKTVLLPVVLALAFGCLGDFFLSNILKDRFFKFGIASFLLGHICYIIAMFSFAVPLNVPVFLLSCAAGAILIFLAFKIANPPAEIKIPGMVYSAVIVTMAIFAIQVFLRFKAPFGAFLLAGSIFFIVSDTTLGFYTFRKKHKNWDLLVISTYVAAQALIVLGFCAA